jgi:hypothetical protein
MIQEHDYTILQPQQENSSCGGYKGTVYCSDTTMPAHYGPHAWCEFTEVVKAAPTHVDSGHRTT